jgi:hypothetical protein
MIMIMDYGLWIMDYGLWIMDYGLWIMDYGLWIMDYDFLSFRYTDEDSASVRNSVTLFHFGSFLRVTGSSIAI